MPLEPLQPGATIGIFGGGQLGRFLAIAAAKLGLSYRRLRARRGQPGFPGGLVSLAAPYGERSALTEFAKSCDVITFEFENVPAEDT